MTQHQRRLKIITLDIGGTNYECQVRTWNMTNNTADGDKLYTFCPEGESREETDPDWALDLTFLSDWTAAGISTYLVEHDGEDVTFQLDHHPDITGEHVRWEGTLRVKAPSVGGDARTTETTQVTLQVQGLPDFSRPA